MVSFTKLKTAVLLASAALLCTTPLAAAAKTKPSTAKVKARTAAPALRSSTASKPSSHKAVKVSSHDSEKMATVSTRRASKGKLRTVAIAAAKPKFRGQQFIDQSRTLEIQQALIREHYLDGEATGAWDQATRDALTRLQLQDELLALQARSNTTVVFVSHDIEEAAKLGDRVVVLSPHPGRIKAIVDSSTPKFAETIKELIFDESESIPAQETSHG